MGCVLADTDLCRKKGLVGTGGWALCCNLRCPLEFRAGMQRPGKSRLLSFIQSCTSLWGYLSPSLSHSVVAWLLPCAQGMASCTGKEAPWEVRTHGKGCEWDLWMPACWSDIDQCCIVGKKCWGKRVDLAWSLSVKSALELDQPFNAECCGFFLPVKHYFQEQISAPKAPSTTILVWPHPSQGTDLFMISPSNFYWSALGFIHSMAPGVDSPVFLWIPWSGGWGKVALDLQHQVIQVAMQSCGHALLRKGRRICSKPWSCVPKENKPVQGIFHHSRRALTSQGCVYQPRLCQKNWERILA